MSAANSEGQPGQEKQEEAKVSSNNKQGRDKERD
jgi:hypothetical protein